MCKLPAKTKFFHINLTQMFLALLFQNGATDFELAIFMTVATKSKRATQINYRPLALNGSACYVDGPR